MKHRHVLRMLNDYADGLLGEELKAGVDRHLLSCDSCREKLEHLRSVRKQMGMLHTLSAPPGFLKSVHQRLETEQRQGFSSSKSFGHLRIMVPAGVAALATAAIAVIFVLNVMEPRREMVSKDRPESLLEGETASVQAPESVAGGDGLEKDEDKKEQKASTSLEATAGPAELVGEEQYASAPAKRAEPEAVADQAEPPKISLLLFKEKADISEREASADEVRAGAVKSRVVEKSVAEDKSDVQMKEDLAVGESAAVKDSLPSETSGNLYLSIERMILDVGGRVLSIDYGETGEIPESIMVEIPIHAVDVFVDELMRYGETTLPGEVILPEELRNGIYRSRVTDDMKTYAIQISFE